MSDYIGDIEKSVNRQMLDDEFLSIRIKHGLPNLDPLLCPQYPQDLLTDEAFEV